MKSTKLADGTRVDCLRRTEAWILDHHVECYFNHGIHVGDGATVVDVGANIGIFGLRVLQKARSVRVIACEPVPAIFECLQENAKRYSDGRFVPIECGIARSPGRASFTYYPHSPALSTSHPEHWTGDALETAVNSSMKNLPGHLWYFKAPPLTRKSSDRKFNSSA